MFPDFTPFDITVQAGITIHGIRSGTGRPLLLLHGFPQTHHMWSKVAPQLSKTFTVIAIDLRGYGASSKPPSTPEDNHKPYAKSSMALDCVAVMSALGFEKFDVLSHDRGSRVAHKLCVDHPERVGRVMFLDICPTLAMFEQTDMFFAKAYWHWFFLIQPAPFPEKLILENRGLFEGIFFGGAKFHEDEAMKEYVKQYAVEEGAHGMCEDYRAGATIDMEEQKKDLEEGRKIKCPVHLLWGKKGVVEAKFNALKEWEKVSEGKVTGEAVDSGHYIAEEVPEVLLRHVGEFFGSGAAEKF
jgi:haloacetate dehalogenase